MLGKKIDPMHPIITQEYAIYTPPMEKMICKIGDWIDQRVSGGYIYGPSRYGKTRTIKWYLKNELEFRFNSYVPMLVWIRKDSLMSEAEFWNQLLFASNYELLDLNKQKNKVTARYLFEERIKTIASYAQSNYVVLVIDEAHEMTLREWKWLLGLQNTLDQAGIRLSVFSIASHSILFQPNYLARTGNPHIATRFFAADLRFNGIQKIEELYYILQSYEADSEWPEGSQISYFQYFANEHYQSGERLSNHTELIWQAFEELFPHDLTIRSRSKIKFEIPMQHIALTVERALRTINEMDDWSDIKDINFWLNIIANTGFSRHLKMITSVI
ncbi:ATP-binding protein [Acinetobacter baumannii]|uniref:ATP-binding protein n=1 Tax=Acinetobacter baumannii TaxID=470 RepID=UPI0032B50102